MRNFLKKIIDSTVLPFCRYIYDRIPVHSPSSTVLSELQRRTSIECADYAQSKMQRAVAFPTKAALRDHALTKVNVDGIFAEFGVFAGASINHIAKKRQNDIIYGFDSFEGLQEDWAGHDCVKGTFDLGGKLPKVVSNVHLIKGWFDKTIPVFLTQHSAPFAFIHCDCDTYEAAKTVFGLIGDRVQEGTVIVFDEYFGYRGWKIGVFKAWQELVSSSNIGYEYLGFRTQEVSIRITNK
jgi:hypothetical protein